MIQNNIEYYFITKKYASYQDLINDYKYELENFIFDKEGRRKVDTPYHRRMIVAIHDKYLNLQKTYFPNESAEEFRHLSLSDNYLIHDFEIAK